jgi:hypothetical protein
MTDCLAFGRISSEFKLAELKVYHQSSVYFVFLFTLFNITLNLKKDATKGKRGLSLSLAPLLHP